MCVCVSLSVSLSVARMYPTSAGLVCLFAAAATAAVHPRIALDIPRSLPRDATAVLDRALGSLSIELSCVCITGDHSHLLPLQR